MRKILAVLLCMLFVTLPLTANAAGNIKETAGKYTYTNEDTTLPYRLILPEGYDKSKEYPLLFFFHGAGERGSDNELQFFHCVQYLADNMPETIIVAPQCPVDNQWVDTPWANGAYSIEAVISVKRHLPARNAATATSFEPFITQAAVPPRRIQS